MGAVALVGTAPYTLRAWRGDSTHSGWTAGDTMRFRLWDHWGDAEAPGVPNYITDSGVFGADSVLHVALAAYVPPPDLWLLDSVWVFAPVALGHSKMAWMAIGNEGTAPLEVFGLATTDPCFQPDDTTLVINSGEFGFLGVSFTPTDTLLHTGYILLHTNDPDETVDTIVVSGRGQLHAPTPFTLLSPGDDTQLDVQITRLRWQRSTDADSPALVRYTVWQDTLADLSTAWTVVTGFTDTSRLVSGLLDDHAYFWTVFAEDDNTPGTWASDTFSFHVARSEPPRSFQLLSPADGDTLLAAPVTLAWHSTGDPDPQAVPFYDVWLDTLSTLATCWQAADSSADTLLALDALASDHAYYWTVRATDGNTPGRWASDTLRFVFDTTQSAALPPPELPRAFRLAQNFPNPFNARTVIGFELPVAADVRLAVYNTLGQRVAILADGRHAPGRYSVTWDSPGAASGVYLYRLEAGTFTEVRKLLLVR